MSGTKRKPVHLANPRGVAYCGQRGSKIRIIRSDEGVTCTSCMRAYTYSIEQKAKDLALLKEYEDEMNQLEQEWLERRNHAQGV